MSCRWLFILFLLASTGCQSPVPTGFVAVTDQDTAVSEPVIGRTFSFDTSFTYVRYSDFGLVEDFNGDGFPELVSLVANATSNEIGARIIDGKDAEIQWIFGAGNEVDGLANHRWIGSLQVIPDGFYIAPSLIDSLSGDILGLDSTHGFLLRNKAIHLVPKEGHSSKVIYWNGADYSWMHQESMLSYVKGSP